MKVFPSKTELNIFSVIVAFCLGAILALLVKIDNKTFIGGAITFVTAFVGAYFAFKLNESREKRNIKEKNVGSANKAIFQIIRAYNFFAGYQRQFITPVGDSPAAFYEIQPSLGYTNWQLEIDFDSLTYLFTKNKGNLLIELTELEELVKTTVESIQTRNHLHLNIVQPRMEAAGIVRGMAVNLGDIDRLIGDRVSSTLQNLTDQLVQQIGDGVLKSEGLIERFHLGVKQIYPGEDVIRMKRRA